MPDDTAPHAPGTYSRDDDRHPDGIYPGDRVQIVSTGEFGTLCAYHAIVIRDDTDASIVPVSDIKRAKVRQAVAVAYEQDQAADHSDDPFHWSHVAVRRWAASTIESRGVTLNGSPRVAAIVDDLYAGRPRILSFYDAYVLARAAGMTGAQAWDEIEAELDAAEQEADR